MKGRSLLNSLFGFITFFLVGCSSFPRDVQMEVDMLKRKGYRSLNKLPEAHAQLFLATVQGDSQIEWAARSERAIMCHPRLGLCIIAYNELSPEKFEYIKVIIRNGNAQCIMHAVETRKK